MEVALGAALLEGVGVGALSVAASEADHAPPSDVATLTLSLPV